MSELQELRRLVITTRDARVLESPGLEDERVTNDGFLWKRTVLDSCFILLVQIMRRQKPTLDVSQAQSIPLYFPLVDLRENHFWSCPNQLGRLARDLLLSTSPELGLQTYTTTTSDFLFKIWILGTKLRKALCQQSCLCSPAFYYYYYYYFYFVFERKGTGFCLSLLSAGITCL